MWAGVPQKGWVVSLWVNLGKWMSSEKQALEKSRSTQRCEQKSRTFSSPGCTPLCLPGLAKRSFLTGRLDCLYMRPNASGSVSFFVLTPST